MQKMWKRALAVLLVVLMIGAIPTGGTAFAQDADVVPAAVQAQDDDAPTLKDRIAELLWPIFRPIFEPIIEAIVNAVGQAFAEVFAKVFEGIITALVQGIFTAIFEAIFQGVSGKQTAALLPRATAV